MSALEDPLLEAIGDTEISAIPKGMVFEPFWRIRRVQVLTVFFWPKKKCKVCPFWSEKGLVCFAH